MYDYEIIMKLRYDNRDMINQNVLCINVILTEGRRETDGHKTLESGQPLIPVQENTGNEYFTNISILI